MVLVKNCSFILFLTEIVRHLSAKNTIIKFKKIFMCKSEEINVKILNSFSKDCTFTLLKKNYKFYLLFTYWKKKQILTTIYFIIATFNDAKFDQNILGINWLRA